MQAITHDLTKKLTPELNLTTSDDSASKSLIPLPSSTCSDRDHACDNSAKYYWDSCYNTRVCQGLYNTHTSTRSDRDHTCDATFVTDSTSKSHISVHFSMYSDVIMHVTQLSSLIVPVKVIFLYIHVHDYHSSFNL